MEDALQYLQFSETWCDVFDREFTTSFFIAQFSHFPFPTNARDV